RLAHKVAVAPDAGDERAPVDVHGKRSTAADHQRAVDALVRQLLRRRCAIDVGEAWIDDLDRDEPFADRRTHARVVVRLDRRAQPERDLAFDLYPIERARTEARR